MLHDSSLLSSKNKAWLLRIEFLDKMVFSQTEGGFASSKSSELKPDKIYKLTLALGLQIEAGCSV